MIIYDGQFGSVKIKALIYEDTNYELYRTLSDDTLLIATQELYKKWVDDKLFFAINPFKQIKYSEKVYAYVISAKRFTITPIRFGNPLCDRRMATAFAFAIKQMRKYTDISLYDGIYLEEYGYILPTYTDTTASDDATIGCYLSGGRTIHFSDDKFSTLLLDDFAYEDISKITDIQRAFHLTNQDTPKADDKPENFTLPGRPELEKFFNEHIVDILREPERYAKLGIDFPSSVILYGPPGCGKTYAVDINASREESGFVKIEDNATIIKAVDDLRNDCSQAANNYLDNLKENSLVEVFNQIVKIDENESFFVDKLIAHYELIISESLQKKETECRNSFESIEKSCSAFNNGSPLSISFNDQISEFEKKLKSWDNYAQPLQVNMQRHGGQHEASEQLLHNLRNRVIDLCNKSQEILVKMLEQLEKTKIHHNFFSIQSIKQKIDNKLLNSLTLIEGLIYIIDLFQSVFAELNLDAEDLVKDKIDLSKLKISLVLLNETGQTEKEKKVQNQHNKEQKKCLDEETKNEQIRLKREKLKEETHRQWQEQYGKFQKEKQNNNITKPKKIIIPSIKVGCIIHGISAIISLIIMIISFFRGNYGNGIIFTIMAVSFSICCANYSQLEGRGVMKWIILTGIFLTYIISLIAS